MDKIYEETDVYKMLEPTSVVSESDFTGLLQAMPDEKIEDLPDIHNIPIQGGLKKSNGK